MYANILYACIYNMYVVTFNCQSTCRCELTLYYFPSAGDLGHYSSFHSTVVEEDNFEIINSKCAFFIIEQL